MGELRRTKRLCFHRHFNYDEKGKVVEIEILNASKLLGGFLTEILKAPKREMVEI